MQKVIITKGLPGSGKSYWAKKHVQKYPEFKRINNDEMRLMFHNNDFGSKAQEKFITKMRNHLIREILSEGNSIIIDNTNLNPKRVEQIKSIIHSLTIEWKDKVKVEIKDFTDVPLKDCIKNDLKRFDSVGKDVIMQMYNQYLKPKQEKLEQDKTLPKAIICDLDGTLALLNGRDPFDASTCEEDLINESILSILDQYYNKHEIIFCSGREDKYKEQTLMFLAKCGYNLPRDMLSLHMRKEGDYRKDSIIKREIFDEHIKGKYYIEFVLDDRNQVVEMWRELGLTCLQVDYGDF